MGKRFGIILSTGLAMFSMFFGAGNVVFPLDLGRVAGNLNIYAIAGLMLTAVFVPFSGLLAMFLFGGDYKLFFARMGKVPGFLIMSFLMVLIGPFMAIPRCITLSYSTLQMYLPNVSLFYFSIAACILLFVFAARRSRILDVLGHVLSPILLISLTILIVKGMLYHPVAAVTSYSRGGIFFYGLKEGYYTMDLMGAFFFSVVVLIGLKRALGKTFDSESEKGKKNFFKITLTSSAIGAGLLGLIYGGFSYVSSFYATTLGLAQKDTILSALAYNILGTFGAIVANVAVSLACLTTAITLVAVFAEFAENEFFKKRVGYTSSLLITLILSFAFSNLGFMGIIKMSEPILLICYPVLIVLTLLNIANKLFGLKMVKTPVVITFVVSAITYFLK